MPLLQFLTTIKPLPPIPQFPLLSHLSSHLTFSLPNPPPLNHFQATMKFIAALTTLVLAAVASAQMPTPYNCASGPTQIDITAFTLDPYPLCINQMVCASGTGTL